MTRPGPAVLFSGGVGHPFEETSPVLGRYIDETGWASRIVTDLDEAIGLLGDAKLLAVNALYWSMTQHEKYAPLRAEWARELKSSQMDAIERFVAGGGRLLALHTATICWDNEPKWKALLGGGWEWGTSHHPDLGGLTVQLTDDGTRLSAGPSSFQVIDEAYHDLLPAPDCTILATADLGHGPQPLAWVRPFRKGKVAVDALGHDVRSLTEPGHAALIRSQLQWLAQ